MLTIERILPKRILSICTLGINELDFRFLLRRKYKDQTVSSLFYKKIIVSRDSSMKEFELKFCKFCFFSAFKSQ